MIYKKNINNRYNLEPYLGYGFTQILIKKFWIFKIICIVYIN